MFPSNPPYSLWSIWGSLSIMNHAFALTLLAVGIYCVSSAAIVLVRLRSIGRLSQNEHSLSIRQVVADLHNRSANMNYVLGATFYLFGVVFFLGIQQAPVTLGLSKSLPWTEVLWNFELHFAFAANVFLVLLILHCVSWFVRTRLNKWSAFKDSLIFGEKSPFH